MDNKGTAGCGLLEAAQRNLKEDTEQQLYGENTFEPPCGCRSGCQAGTGSLSPIRITLSKRFQ